MQYEPDDVLLITGIPGWLGNRMLDILINGDRYGNYAVDRKIRLLVQPKFKDFRLFPANIELFYGDVTDKDSLKNALKGVKTVYHLAGEVYPKNIESYYKVNFEGTKNLVDACIELGVKRFLFMSTDSVCGFGRSKRIFDEHEANHPYKHYGRSKSLAEEYIFKKTSEGLIEGTSLRGFWFFGPFMSERNLKFLKMFYWKRQIVFGNGKNFRSISHVDNVVQAFIKAEKKNETIGKWYWIGDKKPDYTVEEIYKNLADGLGVVYNPFYIHPWVCETLSKLDSLLSTFGYLNSTFNAAGKFHKDIAGEITAAQRDFDYKPNVGFEEIKKEVHDMMVKSIKKQ